MATEVRVEGLKKIYAGDSGVRSLSFTAPAGSFLTLLGPSGCGKTTTLRCLAGLIQPDEGSIWFGNRQVNGPGIFVPPERRGAGMVFQSYALWPHLTVFENIAYPLRARGGKKSVIRSTVPRTAERLGIERYLDRYPGELSGGQQQRVALARSLVYEPDILFLDEPLSNLDAMLRHQMLDELTDVQRRLGVTTVYVTHNQEEAMLMSTEVLLLDKGELVQAAPPRALYDQPKSRFGAEFMGDANFFEGSLTATGGATVLTTSTAGLSLRVGRVATPLPGGTVSVMVRPHKLAVTRTPWEAANIWPARVVKSTFNAGITTVDLDLFGQVVRALAREQVEPGDAVWLSVDPDDVVVLER